MKNSNAKIGCGWVVIILIIIILFCSCVTLNLNYVTPAPKVEKVDTLKINIESWY